MVIKTEKLDYIILAIAGIAGFLGLNEIIKKGQTQQPTEKESQQFTIKTILDYLTSITGTGGGGETTNGKEAEISIPPLYSKAASQLGVNPLDIYDISVSGDNKTLLVRMQDGRTLTTKNPEYEEHLEIYEPGARTYHIKIGDEPFKITPGDYLHNPTIYDRDGFENIGTGPGGWTYSDNITATSFLDWTKQKYGNSNDVLGLKGYKAYVESMTHMPAKWDVVYEVQKTISTPSAPSATPQLSDWQTYYARMTLQQLQTARDSLKNGIQVLPTGYTTASTQTQLAYVESRISSMTKTTTTTILSSGGTVYNAPAEEIMTICEKGADGNMYCHPK